MNTAETSTTIMRSVRFPKDFIPDVDRVRREGETMAEFLRVAALNEVARRTRAEARRDKQR